MRVRTRSKFTSPASFLRPSRVITALLGLLLLCAGCSQVPDCNCEAEVESALAARPPTPAPVPAPPAAYEWADEAVDLTAHERTVFSQDGEDGVLEKIFEVIEPTRHYAVEFGASDGVRASNVRNLILNHGWGALQIEGDPERAAELIENYRNVPKVTAIEAWVWPGNIEILFEENGVPRDLDLLVIDIDSNDYYVWRAIQQYRPKVVMIETNPLYPPPERFVIDFHPMNYWDHTGYVGASLQTLHDLGEKKGYELIHVMKHGGNSIFIDAQYRPLFGRFDSSPAALYTGAPDWAKKIIDPIPPGKEYLVWKNLRIEKKVHRDR